jgi:hypothetical protein
VFPDFEEEFIPKLKEKTGELSLESNDESIAEICKRISSDFEKLAIVLSKIKLT